MQTTNKQLTIVQQGQEGSFGIDALTGQVLDHASLPEWANGIVTGMIAERITDYERQVPPNLAHQHLNNPLVQFSDLGWIGVDDEGMEATIDALPATRMEIVASLLGISLDSVHGGIETARGQTVATMTDIEREETQLQTATEDTLQEGINAPTFAQLAAQEEVHQEQRATAS